MGPLNPPGFIATAYHPRSIRLSLAAVFYQYSEYSEGLAFTTSRYNLMTPSGSTKSCAAGQANATAQSAPCPAIFTQHPEWFACLNDSAPYPDPVDVGNHIVTSKTAWPCPVTETFAHWTSQPCWGNASFIATMIGTMRGLIKQAPGVRMVSVSGLDGTASYLQCPPDTKYYIEANSTGGANFFAANQIATALAPDFPAVGIMIDAYELTQFPPKAGYRFHPSVIVRVCLGSFPRTLSAELPLTDPRNALWPQRLDAWTAAASRVYVWMYTQHGGLSPFPNYFLVAENIAYLHTKGIKGFYIESVCCQPREEMVELKVYLWGRMMMEPTLNITEVTQEFLAGYYSAVAGEIRSPTSPTLQLAINRCANLEVSC